MVDSYLKEMTEDIKDVPVEVELATIADGWFCYSRDAKRSNISWVFEVETPLCKTKKEAVSLIEKLITDIRFKNVKRNYKLSRYV